MQPRTLLLKHIVLVSVAAMFFVASPTFAQQKAASSSEMQTREVQINGLTLHYIELGQGTPVVLVHGTLEDYRTWDGQLEAFSKGYRLISYSRRYHYPNEWPKDATDFSVTMHARDLAAFIKALNLPPVHLIGHSYGAFIAFLVARDHPEVIRSLTLGEPPIMPLLKTTPEGDALLTTAIATSIASSEAFKQGNDEEGVRRFVNGVMDWVKNLCGCSVQTLQMNLCGAFLRECGAVSASTSWPSFSSQLSWRPFSFQLPWFSISCWLTF